MHGTSTVQWELKGFEDVAIWNNLLIGPGGSSYTGWKFRASAGRLYVFNNYNSNADYLEIRRNDAGSIPGWSESGSTTNSNRVPAARICSMSTPNIWLASG